MKNKLTQFAVILGEWTEISKCLNLRSPIFLCAFLVFGAFSVRAHAVLPVQDIVVSGTVTDAETGETIPGVNVIVQGTSVGTATNAMGEYSLSLPNDEAVLVFSFIGYQQVTVPLGNQRVLNVAMEPDVSQLDEVVVVGYGVQKKESVVGAISQATGEDIRRQAQGGDLGTALKGTIPGLISLQSTGMPGGIDYGPALDAQGRTAANSAQLFIRGMKTWNDSGPLVLVDGVERSLVNINPYEIETISVLKDASATAVFGVKGANGVILITTRRGEEGRAQLSFTATTTMKSISMVPTMADSYTGRLNKNYAILHELPITESGWANITPYETLLHYRDQTYPEYLPNINWQEEFTRDFALDQVVNMNVSGGTNFVKYFGSLAYLHEGDILEIRDRGQGYNPSYQFDRLNWRSNLDFTITPTTRFTANLAGQFFVQKSPGGGRWSAWPTMYHMPPDTWPVKYSDGTWGDRLSFQSLVNGVLEFNYQGYSLAKGTDVTTDFILDQKLEFITPGLSTEFKVSFDNKMLTRGPNLSGSRPVSKFIAPEIVDEITPETTPEQLKALEEKYTIWNVAGATSAGYDWTQVPNSYSNETAQPENVYRNLYYQYSINYARNFDKHAVTGLALVSRQERATGSEFTSYREDWVGRVTYGYDSKYFAEFNAAYNGSEKFSNKYRFGFFPSMAFGWIPSSEPFFKPLLPVVNHLKFRYSDGKVGSDEGIDRWLYVGSWRVYPATTSSSAQTLYRFGAPYIQNAYPFRYEGNIPNEDIRWETARKRDFGVETGFFDDLVTISFDYFIENHRNVFLTGASRPVPGYYGAPPVSANEGAVDIKGWEFEAQFSKYFLNGLHLWASHSWTFAKEKVIAQGDPPLIEDYQKLAGYQIGQPRVILQQGEHSVMASWNDVYTTVGGTNNTHLLPGDFRRVDYNSDGIVDANDNVPYGYPSRPQYTYSPAVGFSFKNWSANVRFYGVYNVEGSTGQYAGTFGNTLTRLFPWDLERRWSPENNNTTEAVSPHYRLTTGASGGYVPTSRAYLRLQSAEIAYLIQNAWISRIGLSNFQIRLSGNNLFLWSKMYEDLDYGGPSTSDQRLTYPVLKRFNFGVSMNFR
ncbi:MAG TPA: TonB-dependent receptor [Cyclobacteriaceae bacterium]|nr:TonB-dependent receptor [Cyclobacteriaceae bacterium]